MQKHFAQEHKSGELLFFLVLVPTMQADRLKGFEMEFDIFGWFSTTHSMCLYSNCARSGPTLQFFCEQILTIISVASAGE